VRGIWLLARGGSVSDVDDQLALVRDDVLPNIRNGRNARNVDSTESFQIIAEQINTTVGAADDLVAVRKLGKLVDSSCLGHGLVDGIPKHVVGDTDGQGVGVFVIADVLVGILGRSQQDTADDIPNDVVMPAVVGESDGNGLGIGCGIVRFLDADVSQLVKAEILI